MSDVTEIRNAHRHEIFEALVVAAIRSDNTKFDTFRIEWDRMVAMEPNGALEQYGSMYPIPYAATGRCLHCGQDWRVCGMGFGVIDPGLAIAAHVAQQCPSSAECWCWSSTATPEYPFGIPRCQQCTEEMGDCTCEQGPLFGPCAEIQRLERQGGIRTE